MSNLNIINIIMLWLYIDAIMAIFVFSGINVLAAIRGFESISKFMEAGIKQAIKFSPQYADDPRDQCYKVVVYSMKIIFWLALCTFVAGIVIQLAITIVYGSILALSLF